jgi:hypothetical protein
MRLTRALMIGCPSGRHSSFNSSSSRAVATPGLNRPTRAAPFPIHAQVATQASFGPGDLLPAHRGDFLALAERDISACLVESLKQCHEQCTCQYRLRVWLDVSL